MQRNLRGSTFYCVDTHTGKRTSLKTQSRDEAARLIQARNEAERQPMINVQIAKAYLAASDAAITTRTWQHVFEHIINCKEGPTKVRWVGASKERPFDLIRHKPLIETHAEELLHVLNSGTVSTNVYLRRVHNFALDMNWLSWPIVPKKQWPVVRYKEKRAITIDEHQRIIARERNPERKAFYELCWHLGGSQSDIAHLTAEDIDWGGHYLSYSRKKTAVTSLIHFGAEAAEVLRGLARVGPLFPYLMRVRAGDRATEFKQRCVGLGIMGVTLHSYRYAWAERARSAGYPERFAQEALGHNSKAVHRAYAKKAQVKIPALEDYEREFAGKVVKFKQQAA
jgi:integrase